MAKDFKKSLGSKNLSSLIPTTKEEVREKQPTPVKRIVKKPVVKPVAKKVQEQVPVEKAPIAAPIVEEIAIESAPIEQEVPIAKVPKKTKKVKKENKEATTVTTFRINDEHLKAVKAIAFWDRKKIQEVFNEALAEYIAKMPKATLKRAVGEYEKRYGK